MHIEQNPDGAVKFKKLKKLILVSLKESGIVEDKSVVNQMLEQNVSGEAFQAIFLLLLAIGLIMFQSLSSLQINSSSRFSIDGKYVRLESKSES